MSRSRLAAMLVLPLIVAAAPTRDPVMHHRAAGTFEVTITPEAQADAPAGGLPTSRMGIAKTFSGQMTGTATGTMLAAGAPTPGSAGAYVAVDQFTGAVDGRKGGFLLVHRGMMDKAGKPDLSVVIAPDTGTGELTGIAGTFSIEIKGGKHHYSLDYTLPK